MFTKFTLSAAAAVAALTAMPVAAEAQYYRGHGYYNAHPRAYAYRDGYRRYYPGDRYYGGRRYVGSRHYRGRPYYGRGHGYRYCRDSGAGGTILGAIAGGLLGSEIAGRGDRTEGAIIGGAAGALAGRAIDRNC
ncbi:MAG TPA: glycine zipper 2TM domain-containing protein [Allosphingosinicella sp.]|nr:glycine zipper 2TM domain-containing protein [Allosphingosinicella sp.]